MSGCHHWPVCIKLRFSSCTNMHLTCTAKKQQEATVLCFSRSFPSMPCVVSEDDFQVAGQLTCPDWLAVFTPVCANDVFFRGTRNLAVASSFRRVLFLEEMKKINLPHDVVVSHITRLDFLLWTQTERREPTAVFSWNKTITLFQITWSLFSSLMLILCNVKTTVFVFFLNRI